MDSIIQRSITITITETWTIVWLLDDDPLRHLSTIEQAQLNTQKEPEETFQTTLSVAVRPPFTPAVLAPQPDDGTTRAAASLSHRPTRRAARSSRVMNQDVLQKRDVVFQKGEFK